MMTGLTGSCWGFRLFIATSLMAPPITFGLAPVSLGLFAMYAAIWVYARPRRFDVDPDTLTIRYPGWINEIPISEIREVEVYTDKSFSRVHGWGARIGAGGLWGAFGLLVTRKTTFEMYVSRISDLVVLRCDGRRDLLVSPEDIDGFADAIRVARAK